MGNGKVCYVKVKPITQDKQEETISFDTWE